MSKCCEVIEIESTSTLSVSVVIPTAGLVDIRPVLQAIERCSTEASIAEVIIVAPLENMHLIEKETSEILAFLSFRLNLLASPKKGQVYQRMLGFRAVTFPLVLQLDDDVLLTSKSLMELRGALLTKGPGNVVGPIFIDSLSCQPSYQYPDGLIKRAFQNIIDVVVFGFPWGLRKMGRFSSLNRSYSIDPRHATERYQAVEWLAGGCVLGFRDDLVLEDFYCREGKAYSEDLLHSRLRDQKGIHHWQCSKASASTDLFIVSGVNSGVLGAFSEELDMLKRDWRISCRLGASLCGRVRLMIYLLLRSFVVVLR